MLINLYIEYIGLYLIGEEKKVFIPVTQPTVSQQGFSITENYSESNASGNYSLLNISKCCLVIMALIQSIFQSTL